MEWRRSQMFSMRQGLRQGELFSTLIQLGYKSDDNIQQNTDKGNDNQQ